MINSRNIDDLTEEAAKLCKEWILKCKESGISVLVYSTYRDAEAQRAEYLKGRTGIKGEKIVTYKDGYKQKSKHQERIAWDAVPLKNGKADWSNDESYRKMADIAIKLGIKPGYYWKLVDKPHFEI
jgi:peptidoglycan L-alanyl-D-glutamate endopeptidase CwlK